MLQSNSNQLGFVLWPEPLEERKPKHLHSNQLGFVLWPELPAMPEAPVADSNQLGFVLWPELNDDCPPAQRNSNQLGFVLWPEHSVFLVGQENDSNQLGFVLWPEHVAKAVVPKEILTNWVLYSGQNTIADLHARHAVNEKEAVQCFARVSTKLRDQLAGSPLGSLMGC